MNEKSFVLHLPTAPIMVPIAKVEHLFQKARKTASVEAQKIEHPFTVDTLEGKMAGKAGDYLMRGVKGELYPCAAEVFHSSYEWEKP